MVATASAAELQAREAFRFFDMPRELRDMVYTMLYGERKVFKFTTRRSFNNTERDRKKKYKKDHVPATCPDSSVSHLLSINKQFFEEAAMVWMARQVVTCYAPSELLRCLGYAYPLDRQILQYITEVTFETVIWETTTTERLMRGLPRLSRVTVKMESSDLEEPDDDSDGGGGGDRRGRRLPWEYEFSDAELTNNCWIRPLLDFRGLKSLKLTWIDCVEAESVEEKSIWADNKTRLEQLLADVVTRVAERTVAPREKIPTLDQALHAAMAAKRSQTPTMPTTLMPAPIERPVPPLNDREIPRSPDGLIRLVLLRPEATLKWMQAAMTWKRAWAPLLCLW